MGAQEYFEWWMNLSVSDIDFLIFTDFGVFAIASVLFLALKAKIGDIKAFVFAPMSILLEHTMFSTLELINNSYFAMAMFIVVTGLLSLYVIYSLLLKDHSS